LVPFEFSAPDNSKPYSEIHSDGVTVYAESFEVKKDLLIFDVEVINESGRILHIDPEIIFFQFSKDQFPDQEIEYDPILNISNYAKSPDLIREYYEMKVRKNRSTKTLLAILETGLIVYDVIKDGQDYHSEPTLSRVNRSIARDIGITASLTAIDIGADALEEKQFQTDEDLYYLPEEILLPGPLNPGESTRGKVYFRQYHKHKHYHLTIPVEDQFFEFDFRWPKGEEKRMLRNY
jgi:hypothetical protein